MAEGITTVGATPVETTTIGGRSGERSPGEMLRAGREQALEEAKGKVRDLAEQQRGRAAQAVGGMAGALHKAADDLKAENEIMGRYTNLAADRLDDVANYLRNTDWNDVVQGAEGFARRQPYWFIGGALAAGFVLARFVKSSGGAEQRQSSADYYAGRLASSSTAGYGTSTEAGLYPPTTSATRPISSTLPGGEV